MKGNENRENGKGFEDVFTLQAKLNGLFPFRNELACRYVGSKVITLKSNLDFTVITRNGKVAFLDCKTFQNPYFTFSEIKPSQLKLASDYEFWNVPSGFVVLFMKTRQVVYYTARRIELFGPGARFLPESGLSLGKLESFDLRLVYP